jgi:hypothetical protein
MECQAGNNRSKSFAEFPFSAGAIAAGACIAFFWHPASRIKKAVTVMALKIRFI